MPTPLVLSIVPAAHAADAPAGSSATSAPLDAATLRRADDRAHEDSAAQMSVDVPVKLCSVNTPFGSTVKMSRPT